MSEVGRAINPESSESQSDPNRANPSFSSSKKEAFASKGLSFKSILVLILLMAFIWAIILVWYVLKPKELMPGVGETNQRQVVGPPIPAKADNQSPTETNREIIYASLGQLFVYNPQAKESFLLPIDDLKATQVGSKKPTSFPQSLAFSPNGRYLFFNNNSEDFYIFDFTQKKVVSKLKIGPNPFVSTSDVSADNRYLIVDTGTAPGSRGKTLLDM